MSWWFEPPIWQRLSSNLESFRHFSWWSEAIFETTTLRRGLLIKKMTTSMNSFCWWKKILLTSWKMGSLSHSLHIFFATSQVGFLSRKSLNVPSTCHHFKRRNLELLSIMPGSGNETVEWGWIMFSPQKTRWFKGNFWQTAIVLI